MKLNFLLPLILMGCAAKVPTTTTTIQIKTAKKTNQGTPFYAVVKSSDYSSFLVDDYKKIATEVVSGKEDPACLNTTVFIPGETKTIEVKSAEDKAVAVYFIFTHPGEEWKYLTDDKEGHKVKILLGENEIKSVRAF
jgi:hypothetical protein